MTLVKTASKYVPLDTQQVI